MKRRFKVGDVVMANPDYPYRWNLEEIHLEKSYKVSECHVDYEGKPYVQLKKIYSSYPEDALQFPRIKTR